MYKNGSLPVVLPEEQIALLLEDAHAGLDLAVDLPNQVVRRPNGQEFSFEVDAFRKHCLVNGLDEISLTMEKEKEINAYEQKRSELWGWLDGAAYRAAKTNGVKAPGTLSW
jgi:3-isopropylmalate dehydratase